MNDLYIIFLVIGILAFINKYMKNHKIIKKKPSKLKLWWKQSYIREIYFVRARDRIFISLIPIVGLITSAFAVFWFLVISYNSYIDPTQPLDKLVKYDGIIKKYTYQKRLIDTMVLQLDNGDIKTFNALIYVKNKDTKSWIEKKASIWAREKANNLFFRGYETAVWVEFDGEDMDKEAFKQQHRSRLDLENRQFKNIISSVKYFISFAVLIWLINLKPVAKKRKKNKITYAIVSVAGVILFYFSVLVFLALGVN